MLVFPRKCLASFNRKTYDRISIKATVHNKWFVLKLLVLMIFLFLLQSNCPTTSKVEYICFEDQENTNATGLESVKPLYIYDEKRKNKGKNFEQGQLKILSREHLSDFTFPEKKRISACIRNYPEDFMKWHKRFWTGTQQEIRRTHHTYLVPGESIIVDVGGNVGDDAQVFLDMYKPKYYIILEPLKLLHRRLQKRFINFTNVALYNIGLGAKNKKFLIKIEGNDGDASSQFLSSGEGTCSIKVVNATDFFKKLAIEEHKIDLITINCEGCEYDLLETILSTNLIYQFKNIQFATHSKLRNLYDPVNRYCRLQELLSRSHKLAYQYKFQWETWNLKDLY